MDGQGTDQNPSIDNAIRAMQNKKQIPEIDFTLHTMEDGTHVSTQERVCKGMRILYFSLTTIYRRCSTYLRWTKTPSLTNRIV